MPNGLERGASPERDRDGVDAGCLDPTDAVPVMLYQHDNMYSRAGRCGDFHDAIKMVAKAYVRETILRDANCFHQGRDGACSCGNYW